jgi:hypothetical protein
VGRPFAAPRLRAEPRRFGGSPNFHLRAPASLTDRVAERRLGVLPPARLYDRPGNVKHKPAQGCRPKPGERGIGFDRIAITAPESACWREATDIRRELAAQNPAAYRPDLARTFNNLALLYRVMHRDSDAEAAEAEALAAAK